MRLSDFLDLAPSQKSFRDAVSSGLAAASKAIPCRFLYDARGSALFDEICTLPEYYPTRSEMEILADRAPAIAELAGPRCRLIEFGSGSSVKIRILLQAMRDPAGYVAVDISRDHLRRAAEDLAAEVPHVPVTAVCADYTQPFALPPFNVEAARSLGFFPGSTIGNFEPDEAVECLSRWAGLLGRDGAMLIGVDLKKDRAVLHAAYNDAAGVTAAFTCNLLVRANRELGADFDLAGFVHDAIYDPVAGRIEVNLRSLRAQTVTIGETRFLFEEGERIHVENSYKYTVAEFQALARRAGFRPVTHWTDREGRFSVHYLEVE